MWRDGNGQKREQVAAVSWWMFRLSRFDFFSIFSTRVLTDIFLVHQCDILLEYLSEIIMYLKGNLCSKQLLKFPCKQLVFCSSPPVLQGVSTDPFIKLPVCSKSVFPTQKPQQPCFLHPYRHKHFYVHANIYYVFIHLQTNSTQKSLG